MAIDPDIPYVVLNVVLSISILALLINVFLIYVLTNLKVQRNTTGFKLLLLLALSDILTAFSVVVSIFFRNGHGEEVFFQSPYYCPTIGVMALFFNMLSSFLISFLAVERYWLVCREKTLPVIPSWIAFLTGVLLYMIALISSIYGRHFIPDPSFSFCATNNNLFGTIFTSLLTNFPLLILTFCYISISLKTFQLSKIHQAIIPRYVSLKPILILAIYYLCFLPKAILTLIQPFYPQYVFPRLLIVLSPVGLALVIILNPILMFCLHPPVQHQCLMIYRRATTVYSHRQFY